MPVISCLVCVLASRVVRRQATTADRRPQGSRRTARSVEPASAPAAGESTCIIVSFLEFQQRRQAREAARGANGGEAEPEERPAPTPGRVPQRSESSPHVPPPRYVPTPPDRPLRSAPAAIHIRGPPSSAADAT